MAEVENVIRISVEKKIATLADINFELVGGNSDYKVVFDFDDEWSGYDVKTALFVFGNKSVHKPFSGNICDGVAIENATICLVGVYSGNLATTTPASLLGINLSIRDVANEFPEAPEEDVYNQIIELINKYISQGGGEVPEEDVVEIIEKYFEENPIPKEVQNITSIDTVYDTVDDLPTNNGEGTTLLVLSEKSLYSYNSTAKAWEFKSALKPHTVYCVLEGEKAGLYRFTMASPYLVSVESHTLQEAKDYTDEAIQNIVGYASDKPTEGLEYILSADGTYYICDGGDIAGDIIIPSEHNGLPVKEIAEYAFYGDRRGYKLLTSVVIPSSIERIGYGAFYAQWHLSKIVFQGKPVSIEYDSFRTDDLAEHYGEQAVPCNIYVPWSEGEVAGAPWGCGVATIHYDTKSIKDRIDELENKIGDIDTALDELHSYAQSLAGGATV